MDNIGLIGHSRGGEAVYIAGAFNRLKHYPDDATVEFDFGFDIKGVVSIAPVDGQYLPTGRKVRFRLKGLPAGRLYFAVKSFDEASRAALYRRLEKFGIRT